MKKNLFIVIFCIVNLKSLGQNQYLPIEKASFSIGLVSNTAISDFNSYLDLKNKSKTFFGINSNYLINPFYKNETISKVLVGPEISILKFGKDPILNSNANIFTDYAITHLNLLSRFRPSLEINKFNPFIDFSVGLRRVSSKISETFGEENVEVIDKLKSNSVGYSLGIGNSFFIKNSNQQVRVIDLLVKLNSGSAIKLIDRNSVKLNTNEVVFDTFTSNYSNIELSILFTGFR